jgi:hypothetical protein
MDLTVSTSHVFAKKMTTIIPAAMRAAIVKKDQGIFTFDTFTSSSSLGIF